MPINPQQNCDTERVVVADVYLYAGFCLLTLGVYLTLGVGVACLVSGVLLMVSGGLDGGGRKR